MGDLERALIDAMLSVADAKSCSYIAGPLTSGLGFLTGEVSPTAVESQNRARMARVASELRGQLAHPVLNPGLLQLPDWDGADYGRFFLRVMETLCFEVRLMEGWEFSAGASKEYVRAQHLGLPCLDLAGRPVPRETGINMISEAVEVYQEHGHPLMDKLQARINELR